jgi:hypothetical protein
MLLTLHNLGNRPCRVTIHHPDRGKWALRELAGDSAYEPAGERLEVRPYGYRWIKVIEGSNS